VNVDVLVPIAGMLAGVATVVTLGWTVRHWIDRHYDAARRAAGGDAGGEAVERLTERVGTLEEQLAGRMLDLEERMDFAERVLAQSRDRPQLSDR